ncbi:unnamed protein product [Lepeophtheirus salmonis]|uniref:(salmon louse) hypothetical protein n=1 Tax=Lepeophtheirus salmonis TaxID=72036 RepID=A0A7R8CIS2_LEPSM|nr:unnamed protein product [Lepeophtheirus salmonis]CAF2804104.1 unnamed protein product [Lepeophtheirus salmonis]
MCCTDSIRVGRLKDLHLHNLGGTIEQLSLKGFFFFHPHCHYSKRYLRYQSSFLFQRRQLFDFEKDSTVPWTSIPFTSCGIKEYTFLKLLRIIFVNPSSSIIHPGILSCGEIRAKSILDFCSPLDQE